MTLLAFMILFLWNIALTDEVNKMDKRIKELEKK